MLQRIIAMGIPVCGLLLAGCSPLDLNGNWSWPGGKAQSRTPARVADVWTDTVLNEPGKVGIRGFGGRVMFYDERDDKPVVVEGTLTVYAFADDDADLTNSVPEKKFIFPADKLQRHYSESSIGHSYSFWLPWDEVGQRERQISLMTRFEDHNGRVVVGRPIRKTLPGRIESPEVSPAVAQAWPKTAGGSPTHETVQPVSHHEIIEPLRIERRTVTIDVPKQFAGKYLAAPQHTTDEALTTTGAMVPSVTPLSRPATVVSPANAAAGGAGSDTAGGDGATTAGGGDGDAAGACTTSSFRTWEIPGSNKSIRWANARSDSEATTPCNVAVRPAIDTSI